jgi:predicted nuclease of predicted toxin-antitoxin system
MKIKLDENLPTDLKDLLAFHGHDVDTVPEELLTGQPDAAVFAAAQGEQRLLFTQDLDFSDRRRFAPGSHSGIVLLRLRFASRRQLVGRVRQVLATERVGSWEGCFVVISDFKLRVRRPS